MPSIPQSLLWISLVVLWLFVLVPMLISKRDAVRRTSDVALATRVLNSGTGSRLRRRNGPAAGHRSDPDWRPENDGYADPDLNEADDPPRVATAIVKAAAVAQAQPDYIDVDVVEEDSGALPAGGGDRLSGVCCDEPVGDHFHSADQVAGTAAHDQGETCGQESHGPEGNQADADEPQDVVPDQDAEAQRFEYIEDTSGLEAAEEPAATVTRTVPRRYRYESKTAAAVSARKYTFRKRVLMTMALMLAASAVAAFTIAPRAWWVCGGGRGDSALFGVPAPADPD